MAIPRNLKPGSSAVPNPWRTSCSPFLWTHLRRYRPGTARHFEAGRLLAVVVTEPSGSIRHQITQLTRGQVIIEQTSPYCTDDLAAWLILAEVDSTFQDGSELEVTVIPWEDHTNS